MANTDGQSRPLTLPITLTIGPPPAYAAEPGPHEEVVWISQAKPSSHPDGRPASTPVSPLLQIAFPLSTDALAAAVAAAGGGSPDQVAILMDAQTTGTDSKQLKTAPVPEATEEEDVWEPVPIEHDTVKWSDLSAGGKAQRVFWDWLAKPALILALLYLFVCSLDLMSSAFRLLGGKEAGEVFSDSELLNNPVCGLMIGILATVLVQSSSTSTSIVVSIVAAGILPVKPAIFIVMGANIGTSVTNTIVSLAQSGNRNEFRRAFAGATIHDMFNWLSVLVLLPLEVATGYLYRLTSAIVSGFNIQGTGGAKVQLLKVLTKPFSKLIISIDSKVVSKIATGELNSTDAKLLKEGDYLFRYIADAGLSERATGGLLLLCSLVMLCICLVVMVKLLQSCLKGRIAGMVQRTINSSLPGPCAHLTGLVAIAAGAGITFIVQSSSVFTSTLTPLVGLGVVRLETVFPLTLGANIGTTATGLLAALASSGAKLDSSLQIALCHLFFNISGILLWYPLPFMRRVPVDLAKALGNTTAKYRWFAVFYLVVMFFLLPLLVFGMSLVSVWLLAGVGIPFLVGLAFVAAVNVLQRKRRSLLPERLRTWDWLPRWMHSLQPVDRAISKVVEIGRRCCRCRKTGSLSLNSSTSSAKPLMVHYDEKLRASHTQAVKPIAFGKMTTV